MQGRAQNLFVFAQPFLLSFVCCKDPPPPPKKSRRRKEEGEGEKREKKKKRRHTDKYRWKTEKTGEKGGKTNEIIALSCEIHDTSRKKGSLARHCVAGGGWGGRGGEVGGGGFRRSGDCQHKIGEEEGGEKGVRWGVATTKE